MANPEILGLIAGNGKFPILLAQNARRNKTKVVAVGIRGDTSLFLNPLVDKLCWVGPGELKKLFSFFKAEGVRKVIMAGQVKMLRSIANSKDFFRRSKTERPIRFFLPWPNA
jgi:DUF1009 family protein